MFEFSHLLDTAALQTDPYTQLMYVAAFAVGRSNTCLFFIFKISLNIGTRYTDIKQRATEIYVILINLPIFSIV